MPTAEQINQYFNPRTTKPTITNDSSQLPTNPMNTDSFQNVIARLGLNTPNLLETTTYPLTRLSRNFQLMNSLYRSHWIIRRIIDVVAQDMCKNWIQIKSELHPKEIRRIERLVEKTRTQMHILTALKWGRLYGGAGALIIIKGSEDRLAEELVAAEIMPDSYKGLIVLDRWSGITPEGNLVTDVENVDFGLPSHYRVTPANGKSFSIHSSRILRFAGRKLPYWEEQAEVGWGVSEVEIIFDELKKRDNTSWNIASLVFLANVRVLKMGKLGELLSVSSSGAQQQLYNTLSAQNHIMSNMGMQVINKEDELSQLTYGFAGVSEIYKDFMMDLAGASEIPLTKLYGKSPDGMNATGEGDLQNYYDMISQKQEADLKEPLSKLMRIICLSELGHIPEDFNIKFMPSETVSSSDLADLADKKTTAITSVFSAGLISKAVALKELKQTSEETGMWTNITDDDIQEADDSKEQDELNKLMMGMQAEKGKAEQDKQGAAEGDQEKPKPFEKKEEAPPKKKVNDSWYVRLWDFAENKVKRVAKGKEGGGRFTSTGDSPKELHRPETI